jgi:hypothetical protein
MRNLARKAMTHPAVPALIVAAVFLLDRSSWG